MKTFLQNLLLVFAVGLCVLVFVQWQRELRLRADLKVVGSKVDALQADLTRAAGEVTRLDELKRRYEGVAVTNATSGLQWELNAQAAAREVERLNRQLAVLQAALDQANTNLALQNLELRELVEDRNTLVSRFNELAEDYNELAARWNEQQGRLATNAPPSGTVE
jgi:chromosome segregation ATPase